MKKRAWLAWILIASMLLTLWPASVAYALERPVIYAEMNDGRQSEYMGEYSRTRVYDNGEKKKVDVMTIPVDEVQALVWHPVDGAAYYLYSIRDVENDEVIVFNQRLSNYWVSLNDLLWAETLQYDVTYKMAVAACQSEDDCFWSEPFYFTLTETLGGDDSSDSEDDDPFEYEDDPIIEPDDNPRPQINEHSSTPEPTELAGWFYQESVSLKVGERIQVGGRVEVSGSTLSRVTYQIDGWSGDDASNRYCTQEVSDVTAVELSNLSALVLDASSAPLNVPGTYTLRLVASAADGTWNHLAMMTVVVESAPTQEPVITTEPTQEPESRPVLERPVVYAELDADRSAYAGASERAAVSDNGARLEADVMIVPVDEASHLVWHPVDGAEYYLYSIRDVDNDVAVVSNWQLSEYWVTLPDLLNNGTLRYGVNYKIAAAACASAEGCYWSDAPFYFRLVETLGGDTTAPVTQEPDITTAPTEDTSSVPTPTPATEAPVITPAPAPEVRLSASIMDEYVEIELGKTARVEGWVACEGALLERVTFLIKDHPVPDDPNNRFCSHEVGNENTIDLYDLDDMVLDTNRAPLNEPGDYTVELYAKAVGAEHGEKLKEIQVRVYAAEKPEDTSATGKTDTPPENESKQPQNPEDLSNIEVDGTFGRKSVKLKLGESTRVSGSVSCTGDTIARVTYLIAGHKIGDDGNNRYCTQELSGVNYADLEDMSDLLLDTNRAPLNVPGSYTLELWVKSAKGEARCVSTMTVEVEGVCPVYGSAHKMDYTGYEAAHPHNIFRRCQCGAYEYTGETQTVSTCSECNPAQTGSWTVAYRKIETVYNQRAYTNMWMPDDYPIYPNKAQTPTSSSRTLATSGCGIFTIAHAIQWLTGENPDIDTVRSYCGNTANYNKGMSNSAMQYIAKAYGIQYSQLAGKSMSEQDLKKTFDNGGVVVAATQDGAHLFLAVEYTVHNSKTYVHIIDSSTGSTLTRGYQGYWIDTLEPIKSYRDICTSGWYGEGHDYWISMSDLQKKVLLALTYEGTSALEENGDDFDALLNQNKETVIRQYQILRNYYMYFVPAEDGGGMKVGDKTIYCPDISQLTDSTILRLYQGFLGGDIDVMLASEYTQNVYIAESMLSGVSLYNGSLDDAINIFEDVEQMFKMFGLSEKSANLAGFYAKYGKSRNITIKQMEEWFQSVDELDLSKMFKLYDGTKKATGVAKKLLQFIRENAKYGCVDLEKLNVIINGLKKEGEDGTEIAMLMENIANDSEFRMAYLLTKYGYGAAQKKFVDAMHKLLPKYISISVDAAVSANNVLLNVDEIQKTAAKAKWAIQEAREYYVNVMSDAYREFVIDPSGNFNEFKEDCITLSYLIGQEFDAMADFFEANGRDDAISVSDTYKNAADAAREQMLLALKNLEEILQ